MGFWGDVQQAYLNGMFISAFLQPDLDPDYYVEEPKPGKENTNFLCSFPDCENYTKKGRGKLCNYHYRQQRKTEELAAPGVKKRSARYCKPCRNPDLGIIVNLKKRSAREIAPGIHVR